MMTTSRERVREQEQQYWEGYLKPLVGARIEGVGAVIEKTENWVLPSLTLRTTDGKKVVVVVMKDQEGNGPGALVSNELTALVAERVNCMKCEKPQVRFPHVAFRLCEECFQMEMR